MGITAKGAWESVKRHFRELGLDTQTEDFTVVGVGDMSGDVFGNGMLLSEHIRLVAAFDHRHVFVDPDPGRRDDRTPSAGGCSTCPARRGTTTTGADLGRRRHLAPRGQVRSRSASRWRPALGLPKGVSSMTPAELMNAILVAPVDLLWNGGIGTYVKASTESNAEVGDRANDAIRVDGGQACAPGRR